MHHYVGLSDFGTGELQSMAGALARFRAVIQLLFPTPVSQKGKLLNYAVQPTVLDNPALLLSNQA